MTNITTTARRYVRAASLTAFAVFVLAVILVSAPIFYATRLYSLAADCFEEQGFFGTLRELVLDAADEIICTIRGN